MKTAGFVFLLIFHCCSIVGAQNLVIAPAHIQAIAERVFENECSGKEDCLLAWNEGEEFMSLGIGHFIWYPSGKEGPFIESFPEFVMYLKSTGGGLPEWLDSSPVPGCPWKTREDFLKNRRSSQAVELRQWLLATKPQQGEFLVKRLQAFFPVILKDLPAENRQKVIRQFYRVAGTPAGVYALVDYVNFKGPGISPSERYQGQGWGLLQVLSEMKSEDLAAPDALENFAETAIKILTERVQNAPPERHEERWLPGWKNRVQTYRN